MLKYTVIGLLIFGAMGFSARSSYGQWQGVVVRVAAKQVGKAIGKTIVNRGAETRCLFGPFVCAKIANAPATTPPPRRKKNGSW